ncbi:MAG: hypothetical protein NTV48_00755 [Candidatus Vogelbacteria bacterium]|nr:hypothetical protein [Candidatus Vogelbacteria bacterium]
MQWLNKVTTVKVDGAVRFCPAENLDKDILRLAGGNFGRVFLNTVENNVRDAMLNVWKVSDNPQPADVIADLGCHSQIELVHFFNLLNMQNQGQKGYLPIDGDTSILGFKNEWVLCAKFWHSWRVDAFLVHDPNAYRYISAGSRVISFACFC